MRIPRRLTIETVFGCNARCIMCPIDFPTKRKKQIMSTTLYESIIDSMAPYAKDIEKLSVFGLGEPLLDPKLCDRIRYAKARGFHDIGISTNAHLLTPDKREVLLETGIETVIFSIDGATKKTHERIRVRTDFDRVVENCLGTVRLRDRKGFNTRFVVRFVRQESNHTEWDAFRRFWLGVISPQRGDLITLYDMHSWGGEIARKAEILKGHVSDPIERMPCHHLHTLYILADGSVPLCNEDWLDSQFRLGNVRRTHPLDLYNSPKLKRIRDVHSAGKKNMIPMCRECTVLYSDAARIIVTPRGDTATVEIGSYLDDARSTT